MGEKRAHHGDEAGKREAGLEEAAGERPRRRPCWNAKKRVGDETRPAEEIRCASGRSRRMEKREKALTAAQQADQTARRDEALAAQRRTEAEKQRRALTEEEIATRKALDDELARCGFETEEAYRGALMEREDAAALRGQVQTYKPIAARCAGRGQRCGGGRGRAAAAGAAKRARSAGGKPCAPERSGGGLRSAARAHRPQRKSCWTKTRKRVKSLRKSAARQTRWRLCGLLRRQQGAHAVQLCAASDAGCGGGTGKSFA